MTFFCVLSNYSRFSTMKVRFQREIAIISLLSCPFFKKGQTTSVSGFGKLSPGDSKRIQIRASEHGIQPILVFLQSAIHCFLVAELALDNSQCVLYLAPYRGFAVFDVMLSVSSVIADLGETAGAAVNTEVNF